MPQEGFRSAIYRSLATCNDPKGVVTCKPIRRPKSTEEEEAATMMSRRRRRKASEEDVTSPASFQLAEVSRGARRLNETIERWSGDGGGGGGGSKDMAKELLRGAMDLQGSLVMLGKLQEASRFMARLKHGETDHQKPRLSFGADSTEELKKAIRASLRKREKGLESASNSTSTSTSTSTPRESPLPVKGPNLIAKLMGLGDYPSPEKPHERPVSDIDTPRRERRSLREILRGGDEGLPPIVLMKPMRVSERDDYDDPLCVSREMLMKLRKSQELRPEIEPVQVAKAHSSSVAKPRVSRPKSHEKQRNEAAEKRGAPISVDRKSPPEEKKTVDRRNSVKTRKTSSEANAGKSQDIPRRGQSLSPHKPSTVKRTDQIASSNLKKKKESCVKKEKPAKKSTAVKLIVVDETNPKFQEDHLGLSESNIEDVTPERILCEATPPTPCLYHGEFEREEEFPMDIISDKQTFEQESNLKDLLLSSLSFQQRAEELFDLDFNASQTSLSNPSSEYDDFDYLRRIAGSLLVDCAFELAERLSLINSQSANLIRRRIALVKVVEEVCDEIEALKSCYSGEGLAEVEHVYAMLERDVMTGGGRAASGMWDRGWRTAGASPEEAERVIADVEKLVLSGLIEEVFSC